MTRQRHLAPAAATLIALASGLVPAVAHAAPPTSAPVSAVSSPQAGERAQLDAWLTAHGVDRRTATTLMAKYDRGELWDSMTAGSEPVREFERPTLDGSELVTVFQDGSIQLSGVTREGTGGQAGRTTLATGTKNCSGASGTGYSSQACDVYGDNGIVYITFRATWERFQGGGANITVAEAPRVSVIGGAHANESSQILKRSAQASGLDPDARATASTTVTMYNSTASTTAFLILLVPYDGTSRVRFEA